VLKVKFYYAIQFANQLAELDSVMEFDLNRFSKFFHWQLSSKLLAQK